MLRQKSSGTPTLEGAGGTVASSALFIGGRGGQELPFILEHSVP